MCHCAIELITIMELFNFYLNNQFDIYLEFVQAMYRHTVSDSIILLSKLKKYIFIPKSKQKSILFAYDYHNLFNGNISAIAWKSLYAFYIRNFSLFILFLCCSALFQTRLSHYAWCHIHFHFDYYYMTPNWESSETYKNFFFIFFA